MTEVATLNWLVTEDQSPRAGKSCPVLSRGNEANKDWSRGWEQKQGLVHEGG